MKRFLLIITLLFSAFFTGKATHIIHGNWTYEYLGNSGNGKWKYKISLNLYRDCRASQVVFDDFISVGAYNGQMPWQLVRVYDLEKKFEVDEIPMSIVNSSVLSNDICYKKGVYETEIELSRSLQGYYLSWERCCKTTSNNLLDDQPSNYTVYIPGEPNSLASAFFDGVAILNTGILSQLSIKYYDFDGDSISYELTSLMAGTLSNSTSVRPPPSMLSFPIKEVRYRNSYSAQMPLGQFSTCKVSNVGVLDMLSNNVGHFFIGIKVTEWRNGKKLTEQIRELPTIFISSQQNTTEVYLNADGAKVRKEIRLNWGMTLVSLEADSFEIERRVKGTQAWNKVTTLLPENFSYLDTAINYDIAYEYRIIAQLDNGGSKISNIDEAIVLSWDPSTSVKELKEDRFTIYPNPASDKLFINLTEQIEIVKITITDIQGKTVLQNQNIYDVLASGINVSHLPQGVYLVKILSQTGSIETQKIIKQ